MSTERKKLTAKQKQFCQEYLIDLNASAAARRAGYSPRTAFRAGQENMQKPAIQETIQKAIEERSNRTQITADQILQALKDIVEDSTKLDDSGKMLDASAACRALELLGKHLRMFVDRVEKKEKINVYVKVPSRPSQEQWQKAVKQYIHEPQPG